MPRYSLAQKAKHTQLFFCPYCGRSLATSGGIRSHIRQTPACQAEEDSRTSLHLNNSPGLSPPISLATSQL
jgi:hypothetical protein